ncbi:MAG: cofactor-independent phosphoglycerate mutase [Archaeoglobaceae archaeon]
MKYLLLIPDGMADWPIKQIGNKTPLEYADTPNMDYLADEGACGTAKTVPDNFEPGSDIANMTILGVDPVKYYTGRGPIEALVRDINAQMIFRCNLVYVEDGIMKDHSGRKIGDEEAREIIDSLNEGLGENTRFHKGKSYRNLLAIDSDSIDSDSDYNVKTTPPHNILEKRFEDYLPSDGTLASLLNHLIEESKEIMKEKTANMIWPWSGGKIPSFPNFTQRWGVKGVMISEVDLLQGIGKGMGLEVEEVPGMTAYIDTNYRGLARATLKNLGSSDFVALHLEGIDETGHEGSLENKIEGIELYDEKIVGHLLDRLELDETRIMLLPDHPTPISVRTHVAEPVPFVYYGKKRDDVKSFSERACRKGLLGQVDGLKLMEILFTTD